MGCILTRIIPGPVTDLGVFIQRCGSGNGLRMVHEFVHVSLLVEVCKAFGEAVDEHTRVRCFNAYERIGPVLAINWNEGFSDRSFRTGCEVSVFFVGDCVRSCAVDLDSAKESTVCE